MSPLKVCRPAARSLVVAIASVAVLLPLVSAEASIEPRWERLNHLRQILDTREISDLFEQQVGGQPIDSIEWVGEEDEESVYGGTHEEWLLRLSLLREPYLVRAGTCALEVDFVPSPEWLERNRSEPVIGSPEWAMQLGEVVCQ